MTASAIIAIWLVALAAQSTVPPPMSVCDVLAHDPTILNGKLIKIRGIYAPGPHSALITGECKTHLLTKGLTWGNDLSVYVNLSDENVARSWANFFEKLKRLRPRGVSEHDRIWVTFVGRLETRTSMNDEVLQMSFGLARAGFGQGGEAPAEINVISVDDVRVERQPTAENKER
jgi:hypothetical protein